MKTEIRLPLQYNCAYTDIFLDDFTSCGVVFKLECCRAGRYEVDGYVFDAAEDPKLLMTGKWNKSMSYQPCDIEGEPLPGTELKEVRSTKLSSR